MIPASANIMEEKSITGVATGQKTLVIRIPGHNASILQGEQLGLIIALILSENASPTGGLYTPRVIPYGFHMDWVDSTPQSMDSIWTIFWLGPQPFFHSIPTMDSIWTVHGIHHSIWIPCTGPCGFHMDSMEFPMNFNCKSMYYSIWNPCTNPCTSPYGFHAPFHMESLGI
jgi:hypothetical protein